VVDGQLAAVLPQIDAAVELGAVGRVPEKSDLESILLNTVSAENLRTKLG
jgi:hypothetical protein